MRLNPAKIVVVGGSGVFNSSVISTLRNYTSGSVIRLGGVDRYGTSRKIAQYAFGDREVTEAYVAAGTNFPDALSAAAAAAAAGRGAPVVIVPGTAANAGAATWALLVGFDLDDIYVEGGTGVVSSSMKSWLGGIAPTTRLSGSDRFSTSLAINKQAHASATGAHLAYTDNFPDAFAGLGSPACTSISPRSSKRVNRWHDLSGICVRISPLSRPCSRSWCRWVCEVWSSLLRRPSTGKPTGR